MRINKINIIAILVLHLAGLTSCSEELNLVSDSGYSPVVYCVLNPADSVHYLRIGKSYSYYGDANKYTPPSDSLVYHENFRAYLVGIMEGEPEECYYFEPAIMNFRDTGFFHPDNLELLEVKCRLKVGWEYSLYIYSPDLPDIIAGSTTIIEAVKILHPVNLPGREVTLLPNQGCYIRWFHSSEYAIYQPMMRIHYREGNSESQSHKSLDYYLPVKTSISGLTILSGFIGGANFFNHLLKSLGTPNSGERRQMIGFGIEIWAGGEELNLLVIQSGENNIPIGGAQDYSNLDGAAGIFSSRVFSGSYNNRFTDISINYLAMSEETAHLGFLAYGEEF